LFNIYNGWVSYYYHKEKNGITTYYYYTNPDNKLMANDEYEQWKIDISKGLIHSNELRIYEKEFVNYTENPTKEELFFQQFVASFDCYRQDTILTIDGQNYEYVGDYIFVLQDLKELYESAKSYFKIKDNKDFYELIKIYIMIYDEENWKKSELKRLEENKIKIETIEKYLMGFDIKNIEKIVVLLPLYSEALGNYQSHILSDDSVILGCDCGCGGDSITDNDYEEHSKLEKKMIQLENRIKKLLGIDSVQ